MRLSIGVEAPQITIRQRGTCASRASLRSAGSIETFAHFSPEVLMEATICFWKTKKIARVGRAATVEAARM